MKFVATTMRATAVLAAAAAVRAKQAHETTLTWQVLSAAARLRTAIPAQTAMIAAIQQGGLDEARRLAKEAAGRVVPVRHTIKIEGLP